jgi:hypothetical protein
MIYLLQRVTSGTGFIVARSANISARDSITEKVVFIEDKDSIGTIEATGDNLGSQAGSVLFDKTLIDRGLGDSTGQGLRGCVVVARDGGARLLTVPVNLKVESVNESRGRDNFSGKH